jgi:hypothetical protein
LAREATPHAGGYRRTRISESLLLGKGLFPYRVGGSLSVKPVRLPAPEEIFWHGRLRLTQAADAARGLLRALESGLPASRAVTPAGAGVFFRTVWAVAPA